MEYRFYLEKVQESISLLFREIDTEIQNRATNRQVNLLAQKVSELEEKIEKLEERLVYVEDIDED